MSNAKKPYAPAALAAEIAEQNSRQGFVDSVISSLGGATFEAEINGPNYDAATAKLLDGIAGGGSLGASSPFTPSKKDS